MKKIMLDCDLMRHPHSGLYHYCLNLGQYVQEELRRNSKEQISFYVPPAETSSFGDSANVIVDKKRFFKFLQPAFKQYRVWHAPFQSGRIIPDKNKYPDLKVLLTIHDLNPLHEGKPVAEQKKSLAHTQALINRSDAIVCISEFSRSDVFKNCETGNKPVHVIHNGIHKVEHGELDRSSYKPSRPFLFGMGYINTKKNYHVLLPLLEDETIELIIAGRLDEPAYVERIKKEAAERGVADRLHLPGPVSEKEKGWYLEHCLAFVHPSLAEGFGAPVVEAMQFGKPLFLAALTSLPEIGGDVSFYFRNFQPDHLKDVFRNGMEQYKKEDMKDRLVTRASQFNWEEKAKAYLDVYRTLY